MKLLEKLNIIKINKASLGQFWIDFKTKVLKSEIVRIGLFVAAGLAALLFLTPFLFNNSELKFKIEQSVSQTYLANFAIKGKVSVRFIPYPSIVIEDAFLRNYQPKAKGNLDSRKVYNFYAKKIILKVPVFQLASPSKAIISEAVLESYDSINRPALIDEKFRDNSSEVAANNNPKPNSGISSKLFSIDNSSFLINQDIKVVVQNSHLALYDQVARKQQFNAINFEGFFYREKTKIEGNFISEGNKNDFRFISKFNSSSRKPTSMLELVSPILKMTIKGNFTSQNNGFLLSDFNGKIEAEISDLKTFYRNYISSQSLIYNKLRRNSRMIKISADINNLAGEIAVDNLVINSTSINGKGNIFLNFAREIPIINFNLAFDNIDLDDVYLDEVVVLKTPELLQNIVKQKDDTAKKDDEKTQEIVNEESVSSLEDAILQGIQDIDLTADISIKNVKYLEEEISNVDLYLNSSQNGKILILPLTFKTPGDGLAWFSGLFDNELAIPKFVGKFSAAGKNLSEVTKWLQIESQNMKLDNLSQYQFNCDILSTINNSVISNIYLNLNQGQSELVGKVTIDDSDKISNLSGRFAVSEFNMDQYFLNSKNNSYFSPGVLIKKLLWLNSINTNYDLNFTFNKLTYGDDDFLDQNLKIKIGRGYFAIDDLRLQSDKYDLSLGLNIDIAKKTPQFEMNISSQDYSYNSQARQQDSDSLIDTALKAIKKDNKINFIDQFYALPSLEGFDGKISINFTKLKLDDFKIDIAKLSGKIKDGAINVSEMSGGIYGGSFDFKGLIGIKINKNINGNLSLKNIILKPFLSDILDIKNIDGIANISSSIISSSHIKQNFSKELSGDIRFVANSPSLAKYGLSNLVKKMFSPQIYQKELHEPEKIINDSSAITFFKDARGTIQINRGDAKMRVNLAGNAFNSVLSGSADFKNNNLDLLCNTIFLTGNRQKQIPINIASSIKGDINNPSMGTNFDQVNQYLGYKSVKINPPSAQ